MKTSGIAYASLPPRVQALVRAADRDRFPGALARDPLPAGHDAGDKPRLRQDTRGPNKTEAALESWLRLQFPGADIKAQGVTLRLANGIRYTPDVFVKHPNGNVSLYEAKGFMRDDAAVKIKVAAAAFKGWSFYLATRNGRTDSGFEFQHVLP